MTECKTKTCRNCGKPFTPAHRLVAEHGDGGHRDYCSPSCREFAANKRRRARRRARKLPPAQTVTSDFYCNDCEIPVLASDLDDDHPDHDVDWISSEDGPPITAIIPTAHRKCAGCGELRRLKGGVCSDECFIRLGNRLIPHDPKRPLTADDITWSPHFDRVMHPILTHMK